MSGIVVFMGIVRSSSTKTLWYASSIKRLILQSDIMELIKRVETLKGSTFKRCETFST